MAGVGTPWNSFGRISLVKRGASRERVSRSSGGMEGAVKLEKDLAADLRAWKEAVRLDLKEDRAFVVAERVSWIRMTWTSWSAMSMLLVLSAEKERSGWSWTQSSFGGEEMVFSLREKEGVMGLLHDTDDWSSNSREGIESLEMDRTDKRSGSFSLPGSMLLASSFSQ